MTDLVKFVDECIEKAEQERSKLPEEAVLVTGMTSIRIRHFLNNLCEIDGDHLEIGTHKGATIIAAAYDNGGKFLTIDSYVKRDDLPPQRNVNLIKFSDHCQVDAVRSDCWEYATQRPRPTYKTFFYDAGHTEADQAYALLAYDHWLTNQFVMVVDDYKATRVQRGTKRAIDVMGYEVEGQWELYSEGIRNAEQWWAGLGVFVLTKGAVESSF